MFISDLVPAKSVAVDKNIKLANTGRIVRGHVAIITKPSPHYVLTESTISGRDVVLLPGLLPIFLHGYAKKIWVGPGDEATVLLHFTTTVIPMWFITIFMS